MNQESVLFVVSVPVEHADAVRSAIHQAGGGKQGNYSQCSFSYRGVGRFFPGEGASPAYGEKGSLSAVEEERIEGLCERSKLRKIIAAMKAAHPYEEPAFHFFSVEQTP